MDRNDKLSNLVKILDSIANLNNDFWINKSNFRILYESISSIEEEKAFNKAYELTLKELSQIFDRMEKLNMKIANINKQTNEKIDTLEDEKILNNIEKNFNL